VLAVRVGRIVVKREVTSQHGVKYDAATPDIHGRTYVPAILYDQLWSGVQIFGRFLELFAEKGGAVAEEESEDLEEAEATS